MSQYADFEEGDLSDFDSTHTSGSGAIVAHADAAIIGSWGVKCTASAAADAAYGRLTEPSSETYIAWDFQFDINSLTMGEAELFSAGFLRDSSATLLVYFDIYYSSGSYYARLAVREDGGGNQVGSIRAISDAPVYVRIVWKQSSAAGADDGHCYMYIDGALVESITGLDNDTHTVDRAENGFVTGVDAGTSGDIYIDDIQWYTPVDMEVIANARDFTLRADKREFSVVAGHRDYIVRAPQHDD